MRWENQHAEVKRQNDLKSIYGINTVVRLEYTKHALNPQDSFTTFQRADEAGAGGETHSKGGRCILRRVLVASCVGVSNRAS